MFKKIVNKICATMMMLLMVHGSVLADDNPKTVEAKQFTVGILMPMDHNALREIVAGFKEKVRVQLPDVNVKVQNANGDLNIQRAILQQFIHQKVDVIVPIGNAATQMTLSMVKEQAIVSLAAEVVKDRETLKISNITGVIDEIGPKKSLDFIKQMYPSIKKITLIYSNTEKIFPEVAVAVDYAKEQGINIQKKKIQALPDLLGLTAAIDKDAEAILILKDHMVVSGIQTLIREAEKRGIPIIASDEGSVKEGAAFALGVKERSIGEKGAELTVKILKESMIASERYSEESKTLKTSVEASSKAPTKADLRTFPIQQIDTLSVFYHPTACRKNSIDTMQLQSIAKTAGYLAESVEDKP